MSTDQCTRWRLLKKLLVRFYAVLDTSAPLPPHMVIGRFPWLQNVSILPRLSPHGAGTALSDLLWVLCWQEMSTVVVEDVVSAGITDTQKVVDDILAYDEIFPGHVRHLWTILTRCRQHGITLNPQQFQFASQQVQYVGYQITRYSVMADPARVKALQDFPTPNNLTELRSFMGLVTQLVILPAKWERLQTSFSRSWAARMPFCSFCSYLVMMWHFRQWSPL